jgi:aspartate ammonia-lyase
MKSDQYRTEHDFLGDREVPAEAYYGVQTLRGAENFPITGYRIHPALIRAMGIVKKAAALANRDTGHLEAAIADAIARAADDVIAGKLDDQFIVDPIQGGAGTSINMNANEVIANRALEVLGQSKGRYEIISPNTHVNIAQSTNDAVPTGVRIATLELMDPRRCFVRSSASPNARQMAAVKKRRLKTPACRSFSRLTCQIRPSLRHRRSRAESRRRSNGWSGSKAS